MTKNVSTDTLRALLLQNDNVNVQSVIQVKMHKEWWNQVHWILDEEFFLATLLAIFFVCNPKLIWKIEKKRCSKPTRSCNKKHYVYASNANWFNESFTQQRTLISTPSPPIVIRQYWFLDWCFEPEQSPPLPTKLAKFGRKFFTWSQLLGQTWITSVQELVVAKVEDDLFVYLEYCIATIRIRMPCIIWVKFVPYYVLVLICKVII